MTYQFLELRDFAGLNLAQDPSDVPMNQAVTGYNFDVDNDGRLYPRLGYGAWAAETKLQILRRFNRYMFGSTADLGALSRSYRYDLATGAATPLGGPSITDWSSDFASCGIAGDIYSVASNRALRSVPAAAGAFGAPIAGSPSGTLIATTPTSDRLVVGGQTNQSRLEWSAAGDGLTWPGYTDDLTPGDGFGIGGFATFANELYAFKGDKFFVFGRESTNGAGDTIFNYRTVDTGIGLSALRGCVGTPHGVFFMAKRGVYLTTGGPPVCVSDAIAPLFDPTLSFDSTESDVNPHDFVSMAYHHKRLYISFGTTTLLVFDPVRNYWFRWKTGDSIYALNGDGKVPDAVSSWRTQLTLSGVLGSYALRGANHDDNGTAIDTQWVGGWSGLGTDAQTVVREVLLAGSGTMGFSLLTDRTYPSGDTTITFPTPATGQFATRTRTRVAVRGFEVACRASGSSGTWRLDSVSLHLRGRRVPAERAA